MLSCLDRKYLRKDSHAEGMVPIWLGLVPENIKFIRASSSDEFGAEWAVKRCGLIGGHG